MQIRNSCIDSRLYTSVVERTLPKVHNAFGEVPTLCRVSSFSVCLLRTTDFLILAHDFVGEDTDKSKMAKNVLSAGVALRLHHLENAHACGHSDTLHPSIHGGAVRGDKLDIVIGIAGFQAPVNQVVGAYIGSSLGIISPDRARLVAEHKEDPFFFDRLFS